jgi:serine/threonine protein kinase
MATMHLVGEAVNDSEREVLRVLREGLDDDWHVVGNFWLQQRFRSYECDAIVFAPDGWAYLVETKGYPGRVVGNDQQWEVPSAVGDEPLFLPNPVLITQRKAQIVPGVLGEAENTLKRILVIPLVVLVTDIPPELEGRCATYTRILSELIDAVTTDPRDYTQKLPPDAAARAAEVLVRSERPLAPETVVGNWRLIEHLDADQNWELWAAQMRHGPEGARPRRLKRYRIDPLATGEREREQRLRARQDLTALERLAGAEGAVPVLNTVEEIGEHLVVVTDWPSGPSVASLIESGELSPHDAEEAFLEIAAALATVHREGVVHRNLNPRCAHLLSNGKVVLTDFDFARIPSLSGVTEFLGLELDPRYRAPEVAADPSSATTASDIWSLARVGLDVLSPGEDDSGTQIQKVPDRWRDIFERALDNDPTRRPADAELLVQELRGEATEPEYFDGFRALDEIDNRWVVRPGAGGEGGIARVYRVHDTFTGFDYAAKFLKTEFVDVVDPVEEFRRLHFLPEHDLIVRPDAVEPMTSFRRDGRVYAHRATFTRTRWIEGDRLDGLMGQLPRVRCVEIACDLADAASHLHRNNVIHRDLKPQNVIVARDDQRPRIIDFNIAVDVGHQGLTEAGTPPYRPPDAGPIGGWGEDADAYAISVILCELLAGRRLGGELAEWLATVELPNQLREILVRGTSPTREGRFPDAESLAQALGGLPPNLFGPGGPPGPPPQVPVPPGKEQATNWNPYQYTLSSLFSQSQTTNSGTRGLDEFATWSYVPTRIDLELVQDLVAGGPRLVVITGNAGDGKTAFIQMVERQIGETGTVTRRPDGNGAVIEHHGRRLVTNWDGSQDEGERDNEDVLRDFFAPFAGDEPRPDQAETRVIAINEGRLRDFLENNRDEFVWLERTVIDLLLEREPPDDGWLRLVNLNLRSLTAPAPEGDSVVAQLLARFADARLWEPCQGCAALGLCYANANAAVLRDPVLGPRAADRIRATLDVARLRRRLHITMRDLRSALAWIVAGGRDCAAIVRLAEEPDVEALVAGQVYNSLFAASEELDPPGHAPEAARDRLLRLIGTIDVAKTAEPADDALLWVDGTQAIRTGTDSDHRPDDRLIKQLRATVPRRSEELVGRQARSLVRLIQATLRRKLYLERDDPGWVAMLPYTRLADFQRQLDDGPTPEDLSQLVRAITNSEGLFSDLFSDRLAVRLVSDSDGAERSYLLHAMSDFELTTRDDGWFSRYVEYVPDILRLVHRRHSSIALDVDLDLYEMLMRIRNGFTPSKEERRGAWLNLRIFKDQLASIPSDSLLLGTDDRVFHRVERVAGERALRVGEGVGWR